jgi:hypothetical protein
MQSVMFHSIQIGKFFNLFRFYKDFTQLIPTLYTALSIDDPYLVSNVMSTTSNLLRHSNCYLKALVQNKIIKKVIQIVM